VNEPSVEDVLDEADKPPVTKTIRFNWDEMTYIVEAYRTEMIYEKLLDGLEISEQEYKRYGGDVCRVVKFGSFYDAVRYYAKLIEEGWQVIFIQVRSDRPKRGVSFVFTGNRMQIKLELDELTSNIAKILRVVRKLTEEVDL